MVGCVLSQLKPSELYILSFETFGLDPFQAKNVEFLGLYLMGLPKMDWIRQWLRSEVKWLRIHVIHIAA